MKIIQEIDILHPLLIESVQRIQKNVINAHRIPIKLFETGRTSERHNALIQKGKTRDAISMHLFNLENDPPLYPIAVDYVYYDGKWSWNLRDSTVQSWYVLFGNLVLDVCNELKWGAYNRKSVNFCHFELRQSVIIDNLDMFPCVTN
jgi:hypothetical protein